MNDYANIRWYHEFNRPMESVFIDFFYWTQTRYKEENQWLKEMSSKFQPQEVEAGKYQWWVDSGVFHPNEDPNAEPYSIVIPPPNVTGNYT